MTAKHSKSEMEASTDSPACGIIMPISPIDGCSAEHWVDVRSIIEEAITSIEAPIFSIKLVSDADDSGVIHKRIVQNLYQSSIVICDVSGRNPNVMFELGMRLAFDKPTIIIKDDKTEYSFDTSIIEHIPYPRDLRFAKVVKFKTMLADKVVATHKAAQSPEHSTFLKNFGEFQVAKITESVVSPDKMIINLLQDLQKDVSSLRAQINTPFRPMMSGTTHAKLRIGEETTERPSKAHICQKIMQQYIAQRPRIPINKLLNSTDFEQYLQGRYAMYASAVFSSYEELRSEIQDEIHKLQNQLKP